jgi:sterol desaturase/sphingolipid hydroxylase (fatty acid hydroxylase superfamily)
MRNLDINSHWSSLLSTLAHRALSPASRTHWIYLLSALLMALWTYWLSRRQGEQRSLPEYLFPKSVWLHSSAITDYSYAALTMPLWRLLAVPRLLSPTQVSQHIIAGTPHWLLPVSLTAMPTLTVALLYTTVLIVAGDFELYWVHRLMHRIPALWEYHKVHHSAEVLTPVTFYRTHPVELLIVALAEAVTIGFVTALFSYLFQDALAPATIFGVNILRFAFFVFGANLRHSHIWFSFGSAAEHIFISPAQHQIHHSADPRHFNRNFGSELAIWDWLWGTLQCAGQERPLIFGLGSDENRRLSTVRQLYVNPLRATWRSIFRFVRSTAFTS